MLMKLARVALLMMAVTVLAQAQATAAAAPTAPAVPTAPAIEASYVLGPGDVIAVNVYGQSELTTTLQVDKDGTIVMPYGHTFVMAAGHTAIALQRLIAGALVKDQLSLHPLVSVHVLQVNSHPVTIVGAVQKPVILQAVRPMSLLDALVQAGGLAIDSGSHILLTQEKGDSLETRDFAVSDLVYSAHDNVGPTLTGGEQIRVLPAGRIYVTGSVLSPGAFVLTEGDPMSAVKAITLAHGWQQYGNSSHAILLRPAPQGGWTKVMLNLPKILDHQLPDYPMRANDILYVPDSAAKRVTAGTLDRGVAMFTSAAGYALGLFLAK